MQSRRRIVMINKRFQLSLIGKFIAVNIFILVVFGALLFVFLNSEVEANLHSAHVTYQNMKDMLFPIIITLSLLNILISSAIVIIFVLYASFRIAGPLYRFDAALKEILQGNLNPLLKLRDKDELYNISESMQQLTDYLNNIAEKTVSISTSLKSINDEVKNDQLAGKIDELDKILEVIKK